ncbi:uncharacterized protein LOC110613757 isoform X2 [Manihot esculenta]|uniref:Uncharacterized protein n=1 Tax=Manihot esculenta TaxID=3983 RepID=A0ACB7HSI7_MANES|nr:uncharacterized protein LOC110613757 isoform X2 [Manihot esculenta]KAG8655086.1 hypothetical protein MANES_04G001400v8 [Manihot esculenta]
MILYIACLILFSCIPVRELAEGDVLKIFLKERELNGDFVSKASDMFWLKEVEKFVDFDSAKLADNPQESEQVIGSDNDEGFLKLSKTQEWILGDNSAPMNKKAIAKAMQNDSERRKKLNLLRYEALKRELMLLSVAIGTACSGYCLIALSLEAAISYVVGVLFSCLYLQLLCQHADNLSKDMIPPIFMQKKPKKIGIRSEDIRDSIERSIKGSGMALSSPRLVIPAAIYGLWVLSHQYFGSDVFDFQIVPAMFGMFVYKAAALVQLYRDNEDLKFVFPEKVQGSRNR